MPRVPGERFVLKSWNAYASNPLSSTLSRNLVPQLRRLASSKLPEYMVPGAFVVLDSLPLTENGKVDRKALPAPEQFRPELEANYVAPRTQMEELVAGMWAEVLKLDRVGRQDNFFELGGHSLMATQVIARLRQALHIEFPLRALFESPTVAELAVALDQAIAEGGKRSVPPIVPVPREGHLPLSFAQQRLWVVDQIDPDNPLYNLPLALRVTGALDVDALEWSLNQIVARHEVLRTTYPTRDDHPVQLIAPSLDISISVTDFSAMPKPQREREAERLASEETRLPFHLASGPLLRARLLKLGEQEHVFILNMHHIVSDGWSMGVFVREMTEFYRARVGGASPALPPLAIQYADYAVWQREWLQGEVLAEQLAYWRKQLEGAPPLLELPTDHPRAAARTFRGEAERFHLGKQLADDLKALSRREGATLYMTLLAAYQMLLGRLAGHQDVVVGTDLANRASVETESLIGFFVNLLAMRTRLGGNPQFSELLDRVRETSLGAYAHQDLPFEKLVEELQPERSTARNPIFQVLFVMQNTPRSAMELAGLKLETFRLSVPSKFDMALFVWEENQGINGSWLYDPDLFAASTIHRLVVQYETLLGAIVSDPAIDMQAATAMLDEAERQQREADEKAFEEASARKLKTIKRRSTTTGA